MIAAADLWGSVDVLTWAVLVGILAAIAWVDLRTQRIPDPLNALLLVSGLVVAVVTGEPGLAAAVAGAVLGGAFLFAIAAGFRRWRRRDGLGLGDVKFLVGAGAWTGWQGVGPTVFLAATAALLVIAGRRLVGAKVRRDDRIAFGAYLGGAALAVRILERQALWP